MKYSLRIGVVLFSSFIFISSVIAARGGGPGGGGGTSSVDLSPALEWDKRSEIGERLTAHGTDLLGDSIDTHLGSLSFTHKDIALPGNSDLPVELIRQLTQGYFTSYSVDTEFGDWHLGVPRISVVTATGVTSSANKWTGARCTDPKSTFKPVLYSSGNASNLSNWAHPVQYTNGLTLNVPGFGSQHILAKSPNVSLPFPSSAKFVTPANWYLTCGSASDGSEGFIAIAPNGNRYRFDRYIQQDYRNLGSMTPDGGNAGKSRYIKRVQAMLMATEVTDVYGNWVRYTYDSSNRLTKIHANDGRAITLAYSGAAKVISSATANGRTWTYNYTNADISDVKAGEYGTNKKILSSVSLPDGTSWSFNLLAMHKRSSSGTYCRTADDTMSLTHPNGVTGTFAVSEIYHRKGYAEWMTETTLRCSGAFVNGRSPTYYDIYHQPIETMSVTSKVISGADIPTSQWTYTYESDVDEERYPAGHQYAGHPIATSADDPTNWTKVLNPDGTESIFYHYWNDLYVSGFDSSFSAKLARSEKKSSPGGSLLESVEYSYTMAGVFGNSYIPNSYSYAPLSQIISPSSSGRSIQINSVVTKRDGDTFTTSHQYNTTQSSASYSYGRPTKTTTSSNVSTQPRIIDTTYERNFSKWILNLTKTVTVNGRLTDQYDYNSNGKMYRHWKYGTKIGEYTYYTSGTAAGRIHKVSNALNQTTELLSWKRGTPQRIKRADGTSVYQYVDNNGWMTSSKDARGNTTAFSRDNMGRLTYINYPGSWNNTSINYDLSGSGALQTITKGQSQISITYDAMFRPILEKTRAVDTGWQSYTNTVYDELGRVAFKSLPSLSASESAGTNFVYDGLGRILTSTETEWPYAQTRHQYYSSHRHRIYDPSNAYMDYYSYGYDGPGNDNYRAMYHSSGTRTSINKNVWGELTSVRQWGTQNGYSVDQTNYYYYDGKRRLCRERNATVGDKLFQYDNANRLTAYQEGVSAGTSCTAPSGSGKVSLVLNSLGNVLKKDFASSSTPDITYSYDLDGNVKTVNRGGINWSYNYNNLSMLESETLMVDGRQYHIGYTFDGNGALNQQTYPTGRVVSFNPDGLGRPQYAKYGSTYYASNIQYHHTGAIDQLSYGNGHNFSLTFNDRLLPERVLTSKGSNKPLDLTYTYDKRGSITHIQDASPSNHDLTLGYDSLNRLVSASGSWGSGSIKYDAMGNVRNKQLGGRNITVNYDSKYRVTSSVDVGNMAGNTGTRSFQYDSKGNVTSVGGLNFTYDHANQPVAMSGTSNGTYSYDGNLKRVKSVVNGKTIYNVFSQSGKLVHIDNLSSNEKTDYIEANKHTIARVINNNPTYLHSDILGSPVAGTNAAGSVVFRERYTPFGLTLVNDASNDNQAGFTGHIKDSDTGLNYMQARYYDPVIGRFLSNDPVTFKNHINAEAGIMGFNRYLYANNNPLKYVDPDGRKSNWFMNLFKSAKEIAKEEAKDRLKEEMKEGGKEVIRGVLKENGLSEQDICAMENCSGRSLSISVCLIQKCAKETGLVQSEEVEKKDRSNEERRDDSENNSEEREAEFEAAKELIKKKDEE